MLPFVAKRDRCFARKQHTGASGEGGARRSSFDRRAPGRARRRSRSVGSKSFLTRQTKGLWTPRSPSVLETYGILPANSRVLRYFRDTVLDSRPDGIAR